MSEYGSTLLNGVKEYFRWDNIKDKPFETVGGKEILKKETLPDISIPITVDWEEQDETASGYIKNKPFGKAIVKSHTYILKDLDITFNSYPGAYVGVYNILEDFNYNVQTEQLVVTLIENDNIISCRTLEYKENYYPHELNLGSSYSIQLSNYIPTSIHTSGINKDTITANNAQIKIEVVKYNQINNKYINFPRIDFLAVPSDEDTKKVLNLPFGLGVQRTETCAITNNWTLNGNFRTIRLPNLDNLSKDNISSIFIRFYNMDESSYLTVLPNSFLEENIQDYSSSLNVNNVDYIYTGFIDGQQFLIYSANDSIYLGISENDFDYFKNKYSIIKVFFAIYKKMSAKQYVNLDSYVTAGLKNKADLFVSKTATLEGTNVLAYGSSAHAEGETTAAMGTNSHAEGSGSLQPLATYFTSTNNINNSSTYTVNTAEQLKVGDWIRYSDYAYQITDIIDNNTIKFSTYIKDISQSDVDNHVTLKKIRGIASGDASHSEGKNTYAAGSYSHAEGQNTIASKDCAHAEGLSTVANSYNQHVQGKYNIIDDQNIYANIVGNGSTSARSNAYTLDWSGNGWFAGKVTAGADPDDAMDLTTKQYVDASFSYLLTPPYDIVAIENSDSLIEINAFRTSPSTGHPGAYIWEINMDGTKTTLFSINSILTLNAEQTAAYDAATTVTVQVALGYSTSSQVTLKGE